MIVNLNRNTTIASRPFYAVRLWDRTRGMIGRDFSADLDAVVFSACRAIHTFFMKIPLDVLFLNRENIVVAQRRNLQPWHPCVCSLHACTVVELPAGTLEKSGICAGDRLAFQRPE